VMDLLLDATSRVEQRHFWFNGFRRFVSPLLTRAVSGRPAPRLIDCGCGTGANLALLQAFGRAYGCDRTWTGLAHARAGHLGRIVRADVAALPFRAESLDVATSFDVLYCLETPAERAAVAEMFRVLRPGGRIVVNVAALDILRGDHSVLGHELRRYTPARLRRLLEGHGFVVERLTFTNATLFPVLLPIRALQRWRGLAPEHRATWEIDLPPRPVNAMLTALLALEARLLRLVDMPFGSSLLALARKPS